MTAAATPLLLGDGIHKSFGGVRAVQGVSFAVPPAQVFAVIGPNGAGKSTLLNLMSGVFQPSQGCLTLDGAELVGLPQHRRVRLGLARTFQKIRLFRHLSVLDNVLAGFHLHWRLPFWRCLLHDGTFRRTRAARREEAMDLLAFVGLGPRAGARAGALSYGEQRMLEIARALATRPRLLLVDEPAAGLNGVEVDALFGRIAALRARGMAVVLVEHNMDLVMGLADRVLVMNHGQPLFEGSAAEVQAHPEVIRAYLGDPA